MKTIKQQLDSLNKHFVSELLNGNFNHDTIKVCEHTVEVDIDGHWFVLWVGTDPQFFSTYGRYTDVNTMKLTFTDVQREVLWCVFDNFRQAAQREALAEQLDEINEQIEQLDKGRV